MANTDFDQRAADLQLVFAEPAALLPPAQAVVLADALCYVAPTYPHGDGRLQYRGRVGQEVSLDQARAAVRLATIQSLALINAHFRTLNRVQQILQLRVGLVTASGFQDHSKALDSASQLLGDLFGTRGRHVRCVAGVSSLPEGACAQVELLLAIQ